MKEKVKLCEKLHHYLKKRKDAFDFIASIYKISSPEIPREQYTNYIEGIFQAIDAMLDYLTANVGKETKNKFEQNIIYSIGSNERYKYLRELRNAVHHRALNPAEVTKTLENGHILAVSPLEISNESGSKTYQRFHPFLLAKFALLETAAISHMRQQIIDLGCFPTPKTSAIEEMEKALNKQYGMEEWQKELVRQFYDQAEALQIAYDSISEQFDSELLDLLSPLTLNEDTIKIFESHGRNFLQTNH